ncbi:MAG: hypothetical protein AB1736_06675, partial [Chloroflexota bacterium]
GLDDGSARAAAGRARFLVGLPLPAEVSPRRTGADARAAGLVDAWLADPELRAVVGHHAWEGAEFVEADGWDALAATTAALAAIADPSPTGRRSAAAIEQRLLAAAREAGYRVEAIRRALGSPRPGRRGGRGVSGA